MAKASSNKSAGKTKSSGVVQLLNQQVANLNVLYVKLHHYHWYVTGEQFYSLHAKFEELYDEITLKMDEVAERMLALKANPASTMKEYLDLATIQEASGKEDARKMVQTIIEDFATVAEELQEGIEMAEEAGDAPTADMLTGFKADFEKHMWMLRSFLG